MVFWIVLIIALVGAYFFLPCPTSTPPPGVFGDLSNVWSIVLFFTCAVYAVIPPFRFLSFSLPIIFALVFVPSAAVNGAGGYALFLVIALVISQLFGMVFSVIAGLIQLERGSNMGIVGWGALLLYSFALSALAWNHAREFVAGLC